MRNTAKRVYISSTRKDLAEYRQAVIDALESAGHRPVCMERKPAASVVPAEECLRDVASCDAYVGIFAWSYGYIPPGTDSSLTEQEFREAERRDIDTYIFLLEEEVDWPEEHREGGEGGARIRRLRQELQQRKWVAFFRNPDHLATKVLAAIPPGPGDIPPPPPPPQPEKPIGEFKDREAELHTLRRCVADRNLRFALVCGRGGMGKTALASKLYYELQEQLSGEGGRTGEIESVVYVPLNEEGYRSPDRIVELIAATLDPAAGWELDDAWSRSGTPLRQRLDGLFRGPLARRRCVIILDNLESVLDEENRIPEEYAALRQFLDACVQSDHAALVIATSRRALVLSTRAEVSAIGRRSQISLEAGLPEECAVALLRELDREGTEGLRDATDDVLATVARRCGCIPRTLETLVGTLRGRPTWNLDTLLENDDILGRLVEDPARELYESLDTELEREIVHALAILERPVPREAVGHMVGGETIIETLDDLVLNLVVVHDQGRFGLHPLDREYALARLSSEEEDPHRRDLHARAADHYRATRRPREEWRSIGDVEPQLEEIRHRMRAGDADEACRILNEIDREHLAIWGHAQLIIDLRSQLLGAIDDPGLNGLNLGNLGAAYFETGDAARAADHFEQALTIARGLGERAAEGRWLGNLGLTHGYRGDRVRAIELLTEALEIAREIGDRRHEGRWLGNLTEHRLTAGSIDPARGIEDYRRALAISRAIDDRRFVMNWAHNLGFLFVAQSDLESARAEFEVAQQAAERIGARRMSCGLLIVLADVHGRLGNTKQQGDLADRVRRMLGEVEGEPLKVEVLLRLASIYGDLGQLPRQEACYDKALKISEALDDKRLQRRLMLTLGDLYALLGEREKQIVSYERALEVARSEEDHADECQALIRLAGLLRAQGRGEEATARFEEALERARGAADLSTEAVVVSAYANALLHAGEAEEAIRFYERALVLVQEMKDQPSQLTVLNRLGMAHEYLTDRLKAIEYYKQVLEVAREIGDRSQEAVALFNIGAAYHFEGDPTAAVPFLEEALALEQSSSSFKAAASLGTIYLQTGRDEEAAERFRKVVEMCPGEPERSGMLYPRGSTLGMALLALGREEEGLDVYRRCLALHHTHEDVHWAILDLEMLQKLSREIPGVAEAIDLLRGRDRPLTDQEE
ncbi:MAG: tetratricopeptide repeat protein [Candidatus Eisenbacteria bacterium]|nr:tetratricopeptide repeat protein [Candidatus Eisenbacteria bacterium]